MRKIHIKIAALAAASMIWACQGSGKSENTENSESQESQEPAWEMPAENIIGQIAEKMMTREVLNWIKYETEPISNTQMMIGINRDNMNRLSCYQQNDSTWLVLLGSINYENEITSCMAYLYASSKVEYKASLDKYLGIGDGSSYGIFSLSDKEFSISMPEIFKGQISYKSGYDSLRRAESSDFCHYLFRESQNYYGFGFCSQISTQYIDTALADIKGGEIILKSPKCGFMTRETDSTRKAIHIGSPIQEAIEMPLFVKYDGATDPMASTSSQGGKFTVTRNIFYNLKENIGGFADFVASSQDGKIESIRIYTDKLEKDKYFPDYSKPVLTLCYFDNNPSLQFIGRYNAQGQLSEYYYTEQQEVTGHFITRFKYQGDTIAESATINEWDCSICDAYERQAFEYSHDIEYSKEHSRDFVKEMSLMYNPYFYDEQYDSEGRLIKAKYSDKTQTATEWDEGESTFIYKDDYCIRTDKGTMRFASYDEEDGASEPRYITNPYTNKYKAYYWHSKEKPASPTISCAELAEIYSLIPKEELSRFYNDLSADDLSSDCNANYLLRSNEHLSEECDRFTHYLMWAYRAGSNTTLAFYGCALEQVAQKNSDNPVSTTEYELKEFIIQDGKATLTNKDLPKEKQLAAYFDASQSDIKILGYRNEFYRKISVDAQVGGQKRSAKFYWNGEAFAPTRE